MVNVDVLADWNDGEPWAALLTRSRTGPLEWTWRAYGVAFTPWPAVTVDSTTTSFVSAHLMGEH